MDQFAIYALQSWVGVSPFLDNIGIFLATYLIWIEVLAIIIFWMLDWRGRSLTLFATAVSALAAWGIGQGIGMVWFRPRPFADLPGVHALVFKSVLDKSFPSDHATLAFALAFAIFLVNRRWGIILVVMASFIGLGRVFAGVHYPTDVIAGAALGILSAWFLHRLIHYFLHTRHRLNKKKL